MQEVWQPVVGWETRYEVSSLGRVRSLPFYAPNPNSPGVHQRLGRVLKPQLQNCGYFYVILRDKERNSARTVHSLVAQSFLPPCPGPIGKSADCWQVDHIDENKQNNAAKNLRWLPAADNRRRSCTKLTPEIIREIRSRRASGEKLKALATVFSKSEASISLICSGKTWGWVT